MQLLLYTWGCNNFFPNYRVISVILLYLWSHHSSSSYCSCTWQNYMVLPKYRRSSTMTINISSGKILPNWTNSSCTIFSNFEHPLKQLKLGCTTFTKIIFQNPSYQYIQVSTRHKWLRLKLLLLTLNFVNTNF